MSEMGDASTRTSPARREVLVMVAFAVFVGIGVATVLVPALTDDAHDEERPAQGNTAQTSGAQTPGTASPALPPDAPRPAPPTPPVGP
jgi:hypothetical protein